VFIVACYAKYALAQSVREEAGKPMSEENIFEPLRQQMVAEVASEVAILEAQIGCAALSPAVMEALATVPRHAFVPAEVQPFAYLNSPLPIGYGKTISQPFIVALMTDLLQVQSDSVVLEIGTGFGYQAAVLAQLAQQVYSVEIIEEIADQAKKRLGRLGYANIQLRLGNGTLGWPEHAPYDRIMVTAAPDLIPPALLSQLRPGGRMVIPTGIPDQQQLLLVEKNTQGRISTREILAVRFSELEQPAAAAGRG
jgi:protein-L-isoaspartate(D-aspartate) O-methyltransferase